MTRDEMKRLMIAQLENTKAQIEAAIAHGMSDDGYDYLTSSLALSQRITEIWFDEDQDNLEDLLRLGLADYACDGIAEAFYELNPPALADED